MQSRDGRCTTICCIARVYPCPLAWLSLPLFLYAAPPSPLLLPPPPPPPFLGHLPSALRSSSSYSSEFVNELQAEQPGAKQGGKKPPKSQEALRPAKRPKTAASSPGTKSLIPDSELGPRPHPMPVSQLTTHHPGFMFLAAHRCVCVRVSVCSQGCYQGLSQALAMLILCIIRTSFKFTDFCNADLSQIQPIDFELHEICLQSTLQNPRKLPMH